MHTMRRLLHWLNQLFLVGAAFLWLVPQSRSQTRDISEPPVKEISHTFPFEYTIAILFVLLVLVILCKPSRKA